MDKEDLIQKEAVQEIKSSTWKLSMLVLLILFPIVMLEFRYLNPFLQNLNISFATFIGNIISVSLIAWPFMPLAIWLLGWWLFPKGTSHLKITFLGVLLLLILYFLEVWFFWSFV